ncbi:MAG: shikimate kinase [Promethearchaeota archaeon]
MKKDSIALIGFMATGKTTIGKAIVKKLGDDYKFIETDEIIVKETGKSIPRIFEKEGEQKFREYEVLACKKASKLKKTVISCGGGVVLNKINIDNLKKNCILVLLTATPEEIFNRIMMNGKETRPVINKQDPKLEIERVLNFRNPFYEASADIIIDTTNKKIKDIVKEIIIKTLAKT